jgi:microcompartment protein CcmL/EutN
MAKPNPAAYPAMALLDFDGIPVGVQATDRMLKRAPVALVKAGSVQPGRWLVLLGGTVAAVAEAHAEGLAIAADRLLDETLLPDIHPDLRDAVLGKRRAAEAEGIGLLESGSTASLLAAADLALKSCAVEILEIRLADGLGGHAFLVLDGALADLEAALEIGAERLGSTRLRQRALLPRLDDTLRDLLAAGSRFEDCPFFTPAGAELLEEMR